MVWLSVCSLVDELVFEEAGTSPSGASTRSALIYPVLSPSLIWYQVYPSADCVLPTTSSFLPWVTLATASDVVLASLLTTHASPLTVTVAAITLMLIMLSATTSTMAAEILLDNFFIFSSYYIETKPIMPHQLLYRCHVAYTYCRNRSTRLPCRHWFWLP